MATKIDVPYCGPIKLGTVGPHVRGYKIALSRAAPDFYPWIPEEKGGFTNYAGRYFVAAVGKFQKRHGIPVTNTIGPRVHEKLEALPRKGYPAQHAFDAFSIKLLEDYWEQIHTTPDQRIRKNMLLAAQYWYSHRSQIAYSQYRPFQLGRPPWVPSRWDCSAFVTNVFYAGGAPDPNGRGYDRQGYTGTLSAHGVRSTLSDLDLMDLIFYGSSRRGTAAFPYGSATHVAALYAGNGKVYSLGSYPMGYYDWNYRSVNHFRHYDVTPGR